ncbi:putative E3 ubiquitin-protein ligase XBOS32 [Citrus sinensis]|uniref:E3 ubiquitin-protein ligase XBOS32 n=1 Tax=Citrus sinensis TaxID=2711 RepID=A0ACB8P6Z2_CITSI|nr:putative E3 ubiquitin-protein ligase XBOS32 [Citrus sinensis]
MKFLSIVGNSFGCSASGERLVSAARDGDLQEAKALLEYNPRLVRYSTFGVRNSPLHYSAAQGHHEIVSLLIESGVDINLRNYRGQIHRADYLNGGTALHLAALNGHSRCIRLLLADYIPSVPNPWNSTLREVINRPADGGVTALHMAALNGHVESVQLLLDLGASVSEVTVEDGTTIDLIGAGSTSLHYAACGGNAQCCQILIAMGASLTAENANGWTPLMVARSWHRTGLEDILSTQPEGQLEVLPSPYLALPLMSIVKIARECGWRNSDSLSTCPDPCVVCLERKCTVAAKGCDHEFCTQCALYLCSTNSSCVVAKGPIGSIPCPLCRHGIVSFDKLPGTRPIKEITRTSSLSLTFCTCSVDHQVQESTSLTTGLCKPGFHCTRISPLGSSFRSLSCQKFPSIKLNSSFCLGDPETSSSLVPCNRNLRDKLVGCSRMNFRRSVSNTDRRRSWFSALNQYVTTGSGC